VIGLIATFSLPAASSPVAAQEIPADRKAAIQERDRLWDQTQNLRAAGKPAEALAAAEAMLKIERKILSADDPELAVSLDWLAGLYIEREDFAAAKAARQEALGILRKRHGETHWKVTDARLALQDVDRLAAMTGEQRQKLAEADRLNREILALNRAGRYGEALQPARRALAIRKAVLGARHPDTAGSLNNLGYLLEAQGNYAAARPLLEQALAIRKEVLGPRHPDTAQSLNILAHLLESQGDSASARPLYEQALSIRKAVLGERHPSTATSLNNLALLLESQGDYAGARALHGQALAIRKAVLGERHPDTAVSLNNLAGVLALQGDYAAARPLYEQALAIRQETLGPRHPDTATSLDNLALLLKAQGDYAAARPLHEQALAIRQETLGPRHPATAQSLNNLALLLKAQGDYAAARPLYEQALAIRKAVLGERHPDTATSLDNLAGLLEAQGDSASARPLYEQAFSIRKAVLGERHPDTAVSLNNLAGLLEAQGDYAGARPLLEQALAIFKAVLGPRHPGTATSLSNLAVSHWTPRDYAGAAPLLQQAVEVAQGNLELAAAALSERQQLAMAQGLSRHLDAYLSIAPLAKLSPGDCYRFVLVAKGSIFERQRRLRAQRRRLRTDPQSQAARRFAEYEQTVRQLASLALATPDPRQAQAWQDRVAELSRRKDDLEAELARLDAGFRAERAEATRTPEQLRAALPRGTALVDLLVYTAYQPPAQGKGKFQLERRVVGFVVRADRPITRVELGPLAPMQKAIDDWRPILAGGGTAPAAGDPALALRRLVWEPLEPHLEGIASVLVSPDGAIGLVPLAALPGKEPGRFLIEEVAIAVVPVPRMLGTARSDPAPSPSPSTEAAPSLLLAGDIDYGGDPGAAADRGASRSAAISTRAGFLPDFKVLPETRVEMAAVRDSFEEQFPDTRAQMLRGARATEEAFRRQAPHARYLHLATHGYFAPKELRSALGPGDAKAARPGGDALGGAGVAGYHPGLLSGIALAGANRRSTPVGQDDGILTALEVAELDLSSVELAVLSACETGLGEVAGGEGLLGLQRAFQVAGARSVVASLWTVDDEATRALMARFYENLWRHGQPPGEALRQAQLSMLRGSLWRGSLKREAAKPKSDRLPPVYWAAFVLSTDRP
jgi:CHAT domain-containing protein/Tfp pilus assembly protein PilF